MLDISGQAAMSRALSRLHIVTFSKQEVLRRRAARGIQDRINVRETVGRKNKCKLSFLSKYFVRNNQETQCSFTNSEK